VVLAVITLLPGQVSLRVEFAYAGSSLVVVLLLGAVLLRHRARFTLAVPGSEASKAVIAGRLP
jgi:hypothetical protein